MDLRDRYRAFTVSLKKNLNIKQLEMTECIITDITGLDTHKLKTFNRDPKKFNLVLFYFSIVQIKIWWTSYFLIFLELKKY